MDDIKAQLANRFKEANNVLVSVTSNPSVDQFAAAIALTLILNKLGKHATTVFSGIIPSTVEFLQPEKVVEKNTDSLRDFIISLDKAKADKLRYKIEDNFVKIFITPYHASISDKDLVFSQGDFNVDVVVGLGVHQREELDQAITAHGRILHDATVTTINTQPPSNLGSINWSDGKSSSLCEMLVGLTDLLAKQGLLDTQISNALLTGIVAETQRFSNQKTTSNTMSASSKLLASGANQQLVSTQLTPKPAPPPPAPVAPKPKPKPVEKEVKKPDVLPKPIAPAKKTNEGELQIDHGKPVFGASEEFKDFQEEEANPDEPKVAQVLIDDDGTLVKFDDEGNNNSRPPNPPGQEPPKSDNSKDEPPKPPEQPQPPQPEPPSSDFPQPPPPSNANNLNNQIQSDIDFSNNQAIMPQAPTYTPPPLIPIPADPSSNQQPQPPPPIPQPQAQVFPPPPTEKPQEIRQDPMGSSDAAFLNDGPKLVLQPPSMSNQLDSSSNPIGDNSFIDPLSSDPQNASNAPPQQQPLLSHDSGPASQGQTYQTQAEPPVIPPMPQTGDGTMPNLADVRNAVDAALSSTPASIANQPLQSLNAQTVGLNLTPPNTPSTDLPNLAPPQAQSQMPPIIGAPSQQIPQPQPMPQQMPQPPPQPMPQQMPQPPPQFAPPPSPTPSEPSRPKAQIDPSTGLEIGSSIPLSVISPNVPPPPEEASIAPPVPPPLIPPEDSSLPPSFSAL